MYEEEYNNTTKIVEYVSVITILLIILIILVPSVSNIIYNVSKRSSEISTQGTIETIKAFYVNINLTKTVDLPFKVIFDNDKYTFYENGKKINLKSTLNNRGKLPTAGSIQLNTDGSVTVKNLTFGKFVCNQTNKKSLVCD